MNNRFKKLEQKLKDYQRFIVTLLIMCTYVYLGALNDLYVYPSEDGTKLLLISFGMSIAGLVFMFRFQQLKKRLDGNERF